jgi:ribosomal-protein-alanine N-acetyltransferase
MVLPYPLGALDQPSIDVDGCWSLRPWSPADTGAVLAAAADPEIRRWNLHHPDSTEAPRWIATWAARWTAGTDAGWALAGDDGCVYGHVALRQIRPDHARAELSGWALAAVRGTGLAARATSALTRWSFDVLGLHRLFFLHSVANPASCRLADRLGFPGEGVLRGYLRHADGWHDMHLHARLRTDP